MQFSIQAIDAFVGEYSSVDLSWHLEVTEAEAAIKIQNACFRIDFNFQWNIHGWFEVKAKFPLLPNFALHHRCLKFKLEWVNSSQKWGSKWDMSAQIMRMIKFEFSKLICTQMCTISHMHTNVQNLSAFTVESSTKEILYRQHFLVGKKHFAADVCSLLWAFFRIQFIPHTTQKAVDWFSIKSVPQA